MFTGIIETVGVVDHIESISGGVRLAIRAPALLDDLHIGDSIAVNGVCLTAVALEAKRGFSAEAVGETLEKTTLGRLQAGDPVNLERAMPADGRFGGHFVQGHVNATATITQWYPRGENYFLELELPGRLLKYLAREGSIAVEGISLTIASLDGNRVGINIIPHTAKATNLQSRHPGDLVNIEVDMIAKYLERLIQYRSIDSESL